MIQTSGARTRFEFGRHETFPVRHGWLAKGLGRVHDTGRYDGDLETADALGLGSRMAKSLGFWLEACGLAGIDSNVTNGTAKRRRKGQKWTITDLGKIVTRYDPHLEYPVTWWFVHMALAQRPSTVWEWFFNEFHERQFNWLSAPVGEATRGRRHRGRRPHRAGESGDRQTTQPRQHRGRAAPHSDGAIRSVGSDAGTGPARIPRRRPERLRLWVWTRR